MRYRSIAIWPRSPECSLGTHDNSSTDTHESREAAQAICRMLRERGLGGMGKVFPLSTRVEFAHLAGDVLTYDPTVTGRERYTHTPTGRAVVRQPFMRDAEWETAFVAFCIEVGAMREV